MGRNSSKTFIVDFTIEISVHALEESKQQHAQTKDTCPRYEGEDGGDHTQEYLYTEEQTGRVLWGRVSGAGSCNQ